MFKVYTWGTIMDNLFDNPFVYLIRLSVLFEMKYLMCIFSGFIICGYGVGSGSAGVSWVWQRWLGVRTGLNLKSQKSSQ